MPRQRRLAARPVGELAAMGIIAGLVAFGLAYAARPRAALRAPTRAGTVLETRTASFELHPGAARLTARSRDGTVSRDIDLEVVVDGAPRPLSLARDDLRSVAGALRANVPLAIGDANVDASLEFRADAAADALTIVVSSHTNGALGTHTVALRAELPSEGRILFASGIGQIADRATVSGGTLVVDIEPHPLGFVSSEGPLTVEAMTDDPNSQGEPTRVAVT